MNRTAVAKELLAVARILSAGTKTIDDLDPEERKIADKMKAKGYTYAVQVTTDEGDFGAPLYFKSASAVGPFLRSFPDYKNAKTRWVVKL